MTPQRYAVLVTDNTLLRAQYGERAAALARLMVFLEPAMIAAAKGAFPDRPVARAALFRDILEDIRLATGLSERAVNAARDVAASLDDFDPGPVQ